MNVTDKPVVVTITPTSASVNVGATTALAVSVTGGSPAATLASCTSSSSSIATATQNGTSCSVTGVAPGTATITAVSSAGQSAQSQLTVVALPAALTAFTLAPPTSALTVGQTLTLTATPTAPAGAAVTIGYQSGNLAVATVTSGGVVTAVSAGTSVITATAQATGTNLAPTTITQTSTITVTANPCTPLTQTLPVARNGTVTSASCVISTDVQRRGDVVRVTLAAPAAVELRMVPVGFSAYLTALPAGDAEFVFFNGNPSQELRGTWHLPSGLTEFRLGSALAGQTGSYSFSATSVSPNVTGCSPVVVAGSLQSSQSLASADCVYNGRLADEFLLFSARSCVITMNRDVTVPVSNPYLEVYANGQLIAFDNDGGGNSNARISLPACRSAGSVLTVRATSFQQGDTGNYVFTVSFGN